MMLTAEKSILTCPVCSDTLNAYEKSYACENKHTFDRAKQGYVNLLLSNQKKTAQPGDNKEMVKSRLDFLNRDYYLPIVKAINSAISRRMESFTNQVPQIADLGCGVGYYLAKLRQELLASYPTTQYYGTDISKEAIHCANQYDKAISWLVCSNKNLPFESESVDAVLSVFAPLYNEEVQRILSPDGRVFVVTPARNHLFELRRFLFDELKEIDEDKLILKTEGFFEIEESIAIHETIKLTSSADIENLLKMTPFYWRSSMIKKELLFALEELEVTIDVTVWVFKSIEEKA